MPADPPRAVFVGLTTLDLIYSVSTPPTVNAKVVASSQEIAAGGPAANAAVTFAALGGGATLVTALGGQVLARYAADEVTGQGVRVLDAAPWIDAPPAVSSVSVVRATGDRSVTSVNAAGVPAAVPDGLESIVADADLVLVDGHHPQLALAAARFAKQHTVPVVLDGGSWKPVLAELLPVVDVAICSADFAVPDPTVKDPAATGIDPAATDPATVAEALRRWGVTATAVTNGADPVYWRWGDASGEVAVPRVRVRDTLGAGDVFHGAFAFALASAPDAAPRDLLGFAAHVAALRCTVPGPRAWLATPALAELAASAGGFGSATRDRSARHDETQTRP